MTQRTTKQSNTGFSDVGQYDWAEYDYAGYAQFIEKAAAIATENSENSEIIEIGPGSGALTAELIAFSHVNNVQAIEINDHSAQYIRHKIQTGELPCTTLVQEDFLIWGNKEVAYKTAHAVVQTFVGHHIKQKDWRHFLKTQKNTLRDDGVIINGDAFLAEHTESDPKARINAHIALHNELIISAFEAGKIQFPIMELESLGSGLGTINQFLTQTSPDYSPSIAIGERIHPANLDAISLLSAMRDRAVTAQSRLTNTHLDAHAPDIEVQQKRTQFITKLEGLIQGLEQSPVPGIDPEYFARNPEICSIGACDHKFTLRHYANLCAEEGLTLEAWKINNDGTERHIKELSPDTEYEGGLYVTRARNINLSQSISR